MPVLGNILRIELDMDWELRDMNRTSIHNKTDPRPYLNKGNTNTRMRAGNVITVEPGIRVFFMYG